MGEEMIAIRMYHVNIDADTQPRCVCYNDVYADGQEKTCGLCYGTTFAGGIKEVWRVWGIVTDDNQNEKIDKVGVWQAEDHRIQMEPWPVLTQNDYILRVQQWDTSRQAPLILGRFYKLTNVEEVTVRTGNRFGTANADRIAQRVNASILPKTHVINKFDVETDVTFPRYDGQPR